MKHKLLSLLLLFVLASCSSDDDKANTTGDGSYFEINVNGETVSLPWSTFSANENCEYIYAGVMDVPESFGTQFRMEFELSKSGHIKKVRFYDFSDANRHYETVDFAPAETFSITNFNYDAANRQLYFEFEGDLFEMGIPGNKKYISGKMQYNDTNSITCGFFPHQLTVDNGAMHFTNTVTSTSADGVIYSFYSDHGYVMRIQSDTAIENRETGSYAFTAGSNFRILLYKYIGALKLTPAANINPADWQAYNCTGTITVDSHNLQPLPHTIGTFTLRATDAGGNVVFDNLTGSFEM